MVKIIKTRDRINGDHRNHGVVEYMGNVGGGYVGRTASGYPIFVHESQVQSIDEVA
jgi:hypothetical protein